MGGGWLHWPSAWQESKRNSFPRLDRWLVGKACLLSLQRSWVWFPVSTLGSSQMSLTTASDFSSGLHRHLYSHRHPPPYSHTYTYSIKINFSKTHSLIVAQFVVHHCRRKGTGMGGNLTVYATDASIVFESVKELERTDSLKAKFSVLS